MGATGGRARAAATSLLEAAYRSAGQDHRVPGALAGGASWRLTPAAAPAAGGPPSPAPPR